MGIAAMVLGIVAVVLGVIPFCGFVAFLPAVVGLILGIVDTVLKHKKEEPKGMSIAGIVLSGVALKIIIIWLFVVGAAASDVAEGFDEAFEEFEAELEEAAEEWEEWEEFERSDLEELDFEALEGELEDIDDPEELRELLEDKREP